MKKAETKLNYSPKQVNKKTNNLGSAPNSEKQQFYDRKGNAVTVKQMLDGMSQESKAALYNQINEHMGQQ